MIDALVTVVCLLFTFLIYWAWNIDTLGPGWAVIPGAFFTGLSYAVALALWWSA